MLENQLSRYGAISRVVPELAPGAKMFLVCDSDDTTVGPLNIGAEFPVDKDGVARVYTTPQAAVNAASAGRSDVVLVLPGYDHTLSRVDTWATADVSVIGLGREGSRPTLRYGAVTDNVKLKANNIKVKNIRFLADADSVNLGLDLDTGYSGHVIEGNIFDFDSNGQNFKKMLKVGSSKTLVQDNEFRAEDTIGCGFGIDIYGGFPDFLRIRNNYFYGQFDTNGDTTNHASAIGIDSGHDSSDTTLSGLEISNNVIVGTDTASACLINLAGAGVSVRGIAVGNRIGSYDTSSADTAVAIWGTVLPIDNKMVNADSDTTEIIVGWSPVAP